MKSSRLEQKNKSRQDIDNHFGINTLSNRVFNRGKQRVAHSMEENNFPNNHNQLEAKNEYISGDTAQTIANGNGIYLVGQIKKHLHQDGKSEFLINLLDCSSRQNTWKPEDHLSPAPVQEYFQQSSPTKKPIRTNKIFMAKY